MANTTNLDLVKPAGTDQALISVLNGNSDKIDQFAGDTNTSLVSLADGMAIVANGDVHGAISSGQYVYVRNHTTLAEGLYTATSAIAANASLSTSNLTADSDGGFNSLSQAIANLNNQIATSFTMPASASGITEFNLGKNLLDYFAAQSGLEINRVYPIRNTVTGWDTVAGYAIKFDTSNYKVVVTNSSSMMLNCTLKGTVYTVYQFTGVQKT